MITTFYSYKGGTGRTMALANIALLLARAGKRVLVVDFDLEAPGLWRFFQDLKPGLDQYQGLLDMLTAQAAAKPERPVDWHDYVVPIQFEGRAVSIITNGRSDDHSYPGRLLDFTWHELYQKGTGAPFIEQLRNEWSQEYDFTLIDSRTGITDTGGVCTIALPDLIVPMFVANHQSLDGTLEVLAIAQKRRQEFAYDRPPALILPVISRLDTRTEYESASEWLDLFSERLSGLYADWLPTSVPLRRILERTKLPYIPYFSFGEKLAVLREGVSDPDSLGYALNSVAQLISNELRLTTFSESVSFTSEQTTSSFPPPEWRTFSGTHPIVGGLPPQNPDFTGRNEILRTLRRALSRPSDAPLIPITLHGMGGIGKTQIAAEYAHRFESDYDLIWWIPADHVSSVRRSLVALARRLSVPESSDVDFTIRTVLDELGVGRPSSNWLLIYDSADGPGTLRGYMPNGRGQILVTSRNGDWSNDSAIIDLDVFDRHESIELLTRRWSGISDEDASTLADDLGNLPLALDQAVAVHRVSGIPLGEYVRLLQQNPGSLLDEGEFSEYPQSVAKTCRLAFDRLRERSPGAAELLEVCSFLGSSNIAVPLLVRGRDAPLPSALHETLADNIKLRGAIREIGRHALAQLDASRDDIKIHMLVSTLLRSALTPDRYETFKRGGPDSSPSWTHHAQIAPHVVPSRLIGRQDARIVDLIFDQIRYYFVTGDYRQSADMARMAVREWVKDFGPDDPVTLQGYFHLGNALRALGEYDRAREINENTLYSMRRGIGSDDKRTLRVANSHAADLRMLGEFRRALQLDLDTVRRSRRTLGEDNPATLRSAHNLAVDYRLLGRVRQAAKLSNRILLIRRSAHRDNLTEVLLSMNSVVHGLYDIGKYARALALCVEGIKSYELSLPNHPVLAIAKRNEAFLLRANGHLNEALSASRDVLRSSVSLFGPKNQNSLAAMMTCCNALSRCGDAPEAGGIGETALDSYRECLGPEHPFTLVCAINLAIVYRSQGRIDEASALSRLASRALGTTLPMQHPFVLASACSESNDLALRGMAGEAQTLSSVVYRRSQGALGPGHPITLALAGNLALDLESLGARQEGAALREQAVQGLRVSLARDHPVTAGAADGSRFEWEIEVPPA